MIRSYFILSLLLIGSILHAQKVDFAPVGAKWYINQIVVDPIPADSFIIVEVTGEEIKSGQLCRVIENLSGCGLPNPAHVFTRNDSVFFYSSVTSEFELLYDYTAQVGSEWTVKGLSNFNGVDIKVQVTGLFDWAFGDDTLKAMAIKTPPILDIWGDYILEKIGGRAYLSPTYLEDCGIDQWAYMPRPIRCYEENGKLYNFNPQFACDYYDDISSTSEITSEDKFVVLPNPAQDAIQISGWSEPGIWSLVDIHGRKVLEISLKEGDSSREISNLTSYPAGFYFWHFTSLRGRVVATGSLVLGQ